MRKRGGTRRRSWDSGCGRSLARRCRSRGTARPPRREARARSRRIEPAPPAAVGRDPHRPVGRLQGGEYPVEAQRALVVGPVGVGHRAQGGGIHVQDAPVRAEPEGPVVAFGDVPDVAVAQGADERAGGGVPARQTLGGACPHPALAVREDAPHVVAR